MTSDDGRRVPMASDARMPCVATARLPRVEAGSAQCRRRGRSVVPIGSVTTLAIPSITSVPASEQVEAQVLRCRRGVGWLVGCCDDLGSGYGSSKEEDEVAS
uniref:Uncharacterized protein n=1 Tax=Manihot esculenta TaxID=3983 RepID=A0A2C9UJ41_MANES